MGVGHDDAAGMHPRSPGRDAASIFLLAAWVVLARGNCITE